MTDTPYRPSSGSEGADFDELWCAHCTRDAKFREDMNGADGCKIIADTFAYEIDHPKYPKEWIYRNGARICAAFTTDPTKPVRCDQTKDLFLDNGVLP